MRQQIRATTSKELEQGVAVSGSVGADFDGSDFDYHDFSSLRQVMLQEQSVPQSGHAGFVSQLALALPEVAAKIDEDDFGVVHLEVGVLKLVTREAITRHDWETVRQHYAFVSAVLRDADDELRDALHISYVENLLLDETSAYFVRARKLLPSSMASELTATELKWKRFL